MVEMSCEEHDKAAAKSQFITHTIGRYAASYLSFTNQTDRHLYLRSLIVTFGVFFTRTLAEMDIKSTPIDTKGFQTLVELVNSF